MPLQKAKHSPCFAHTSGWCRCACSRLRIGNSIQDRPQTLRTSCHNPAGCRSAGEVLLSADGRCAFASVSRRRFGHRPISIRRRVFVRGPQAGPAGSLAARSRRVSRRHHGATRLTVRNWLFRRRGKSSASGRDRGTIGAMPRSGRSIVVAVGRKCHRLYHVPALGPARPQC